MKMISSTSITSTSGVTLISERVVNSFLRVSIYLIRFTCLSTMLVNSEEKLSISVVSTLILFR